MSFLRYKSHELLGYQRHDSWICLTFTNQGVVISIVLPKRVSVGVN